MNYNSSGSKFTIIMLLSILIFILSIFIFFKTYTLNITILPLIVGIVLIIILLVILPLSICSAFFNKLTKVTININLIIFLLIYLGAILVTLKYNNKKYSLFEIIDDVINKIILYLIIIIFATFFWYK